MKEEKDCQHEFQFSHTEEAIDGIILCRIDVVICRNCGEIRRFKQ